MRIVSTRHVLLTVTIVLAVTGAVCSLRTGDLPGNGDEWSLAFASLGFAGLGWTVAGRRPSLPIGWLLLVGGLANALVTLATWWSTDALVQGEGPDHGAALAAWLQAWLGATVFPLVIVAPLVLFPGGVPRSRRWKWFLISYTAVVAVLTLVAAVTAVPAAYGPRPVELLDAPGVAASGWAAAALSARSLAYLISMPAVLVSIGGIAWACRRAHGDERRGLATVLIGVTVVVAGFVVGALIPVLTDQRHQAPGGLFSFALFAIPAAITIAIVRFRAFEVRAAVSRSLLVFVVGAGLAAVYAAVLFGVAAVVGESSPFSLPTLLAAGAVVVVSAPLARIARRLTLRWFGRADRPATVADHFSARLSAAADVTAGLTELAATLHGALRLGSVEIEVNGLPPVRVGSGEPAGSPVPLVTGSGQIGELRIGARAGESLSPPDFESLRDLTAYVAIAADSIRIGEELRRARNAVDQAHTEERQRVRRDLHDGLGPTLASVRLRLAALRRGRDEPELDDLVDQVADCIREVRRLVDGLQPSVVEDLGLRPALEILVSDVRDHGGLQVRLDAPNDLSTLAPQVATSAYRIVSEALANVVRHSGATHCTVRLDLDDGNLGIEVSDDGHGFEPVRANGMGLRNIATRASLANGEANVASRPGAGTVVTVRMPA